MNFFFDRCVPIRLAWMLDAYDTDNTIVHQDDDERFDPTTSDVDLISTIAKEASKPVFITCDLKMRRDPVERAALAESGLSVVFLRGGWSDLKFHMRAWKLLKVWPILVQEIERVKTTPTSFDLSPAAKKLQRIGPTANLVRKRQPKS